MVESTLLRSVVLLMSSLGGRAVQHSNWNGFDLTTRDGEIERGSP